ncbi:MAG: YARHG domain-containing protein [Cohaesibacter sp.]|jgi:hypothetical protein|nr:YARHG domain-containing protein [Cohaesibacter sp.]
MKHAFITLPAMAIALCVATPQVVHADIFSQSASRVFSANYLINRGYSCRQLWMARNTIYDNNGYCFKSRMGRQVFDNSDCWTSRAQLSRTENRNVANIKKAERFLGCRINK